VAQGYESYVYWLLRTPEYRAYCKAHSTGTTNLGLAREDFFAFPVPPLTEIRETLGTLLQCLEDKIDLNRRMNVTLETMARAIFRDWFVDFGPTRAKMEGNPPYLVPEIWSLFPKSLDNEQKPGGWSEETVFAQANWVNGAAYKDMHFSSSADALPVIKIAELKHGVMASTMWTNTDLGERYRICNGELLFSWSGNPDTSIDTFIWTGGDAWLNQHIFAVRPNGKRSLSFLFNMLKWLKPEFAEIARNKQTTGLGHVTQQDLIRLKVCIPDRAVEAAFDLQTEPLYRLLQNNLMECRRLADCRDLLLPKLMSGEIRIKEAEKAVAELV
jgi:type I restriction enzyme S subunit